MKKSVAILLSAAAAFAACAGGALYGAQTTYFAGADSSSETVYPDFVSDLELGALDCYSVGESAFAFSEGERLYIYEGGSRSSGEDSEGNAVYIYEGGTMQNASGGNIYAYEHSAAITDLLYTSEGLLFSDAVGGVYLYSDGEATSYDGSIEQITYPVTNNGLSFYIVDNGVLSVGDGIGYKRFENNVYSSVKVENGNVYAIRDDILCIIEGDSLATLTVTPITFRYTDVSHSLTISTGNSAELIKTVKEPQFVIVPAGQYVTEIDPVELDGEYFVPGESGTFIMESNAYALVLCTTGNADILAIGEKTYITKSISAKINSTTSTAPFEGAQLNYSAGIYSAPYMSSATELLKLETGATVQVTGQIAASNQPVSGDVLTADFCRVQYTADDGTFTEGYIATSFLTAYDFSADDGEFGDATVPDDYSEENVILTVVLVIVIVVLVIAGVAYLAYFSGASKHKKNERPEDNGEDDKN